MCACACVHVFASVCACVAYMMCACMYARASVHTVAICLYGPPVLHHHTATVFIDIHTVVAYIIGYINQCIPLFEQEVFRYPKIFFG